MRISDWSSDVCSSDLACEPSDRLVDQCADIGANQKCRLDSESVDGVQTFLTGVRTGLRPLPRSRQFGTGTCTAPLTRDFFLRQRTYTCPMDTGDMPDTDLAGRAYIIALLPAPLIAKRVRTTVSDHPASPRHVPLPH